MGSLQPDRFRASSFADVAAGVTAAAAIATTASSSTVASALG
jgi:hypothetical protein